MSIRLSLAASLMLVLSACASPRGQESRLDADCRALQTACNARCERDFEANHNAWDYRSCIESCRPSDRSQCRGSDIAY